MAIAGISNWFNQPGYAIYNSLESLLVSTANNEPFNEQLTEVVAFHEDDFDSSQLSAQLQNFVTFFQGILKRCLYMIALKHLRSFLTQREFISQVCKFVHWLSSFL